MVHIVAALPTLLRFAVTGPHLIIPLASDLGGVRRLRAELLVTSRPKDHELTMERSLTEIIPNDSPSSRHRDLLDAVGPAIRSAVAAQLEPARRSEAAGAQLRKAVRHVCVDARRRGIPVEQLLIAVKRACASAPEIQTRSSDPQAVDVMNRVVSVCIQEYYADARGDSEASPPPPA